MKKSKLRTFVIWALLLGICAFVMVDMGRESPNMPREVFVEDLAQGAVSYVWLDADVIAVERWDGAEYQVWGPADAATLELLQTHQVGHEFGSPGSPVRALVGWLILAAVVLLALVLLLRRVQTKSTGSVLEMRKSKARVVSEDPGVRYTDVGGAETAKAKLRDVIDSLKNPERWTSAGVRRPRGVLLQGPPGCGKTLLARATAGEAGVPFFYVSASEFVEMFVGVGASRVRDMFEEAAKKAPSLVFIDELDAVGRRRGSGVGAGHDEREQTLNQLLVCLDGFQEQDAVVVLAATNRADILDPALLRPGRFDARVQVPPQDEAERAETLAIHTRNKVLGADVDLALIAAGSEGHTGAELEHLCNEAAMRAIRRVRETAAEGAELCQQDFLDALAAHRPEEARFDGLDAVLVESATQLARPTSTVLVEVQTRQGEVLAGRLLWADAAFIKLALDGDPGAAAEERVIPKMHLATLKALPGTGQVDPTVVVADGWANHSVGTA